MNTEIIISTPIYLFESSVIRHIPYTVSPLRESTLRESTLREIRDSIKSKRKLGGYDKRSTIYSQKKVILRPN